MDLIDGMKTFVAAVEAGSFTAAADRLGISKKLVSKYVAQLETHVNARLMHRTTRQLSLTEIGQQYYSGCIDLLASLDTLESSLHPQKTGLVGSLRVTAPANFGEMFVVDAVAAFQDEYPGISIDLHLSDSYVGLAAEGFDLAVRIGEFEDSSLITRKIGEATLWVVASPDLLSKFGFPKKPADLEAYPCLADSNNRSGNLWYFNVNGKRQSVRISSKFRVNSTVAIRNLAVAGRGVGMCLSMFVTEDVNAGRLIRLFPELPGRSTDIRVAYLSSSKMPERQRQFLDFLARWFRAKNPIKIS